jgi:glucosamine-6-phosphate deaminase
MSIAITENVRELGQQAANKACEVLSEAIQTKGKARLMLATGQSHFEFYEALLKCDVSWEKVEIFHLDEYVGIPDTHKASFRNYLIHRFLNKIHPSKVHLIEGDKDPELVIASLEKELAVAPIDLGIVGIGNNGHIAFNDPPANFETKKFYHVVELDEECRLQQVGEGWFPTIEDVPKTAISATVHLILSCAAIVSVVPHAAKAQAVKDTLESADITNTIPATILRTHPNWFLYLDEQSASLLDRSTNVLQ